MDEKIEETIIEKGDEDRSLPIDLKRDFILEKCDYFAGVGIWPLHSNLDPESWLSNFEQDELNHALYLLHSFMFFSDPLVNEIFSASMRTLSRLLITEGDTYSSFKDKWQSFTKSIVVTYITGENPNPTDSGFLFARKARSLGIPQDRIITPEEACQRLNSGTTDPIVIVDDFIGSGHQFFTTWQRLYGHPPRSFQMIAPISSTPLYLCPAFCTEFALGIIKQQCPRLIVNPGHLIPNNYNALAKDSIIWPSHFRASAVEFVHKASLRAGIPDTDGSTPTDWRGFAKLGLTVALEGSVPDATLPLFYWEENGWHPLIKRQNYE